MSDRIEDLARDPAETGLFFDFDGTLSEIVGRPEEARPLEGIPEVLSDLARLFRVVCVVSGRSAAQLTEWLGPATEIWGLHGAQSAVGGKVEVAAEFQAFESLMREVLNESREAIDRLGIDGALVEDKHVMVGLHWRMAEDRAAAERRMMELADDLARRHGLQIGRGKLALELRPPVEVSKRGVVKKRAREEHLRAAAFGGDDVVDLPAYEALDELAASGVTTVRLAVSSDEVPPELIARADVVVSGPMGMLSWLQDLRAASEGVAGSPPA